MKIKIQSLNKKAVIPEYQTSGSAGFDLRSIEDQVLKPKEFGLIGTGLAFEIPEGYEVQIRPRSGLATKGISVLNSPGTIDSDYRGEVKILLINHSNQDFKIEAGDRIAQGVIANVVQAELIEVEELSKTQRDHAGFGSTGIK